MKYNINEILKATEFFQSKEETNKKLEQLLREKESKTKGMTPDQITHISVSTFDECLKETFAPKCIHILEKAIMNKFTEMGFQAINEN